MPSLSNSNDASPQTTDSGRLVVLLHGLAAHWLLMTKLQKHFEAAGHRTLNWGYKTWFQSIDTHAQRLHQQLTDLDKDPTIQTIDFVSHSMGCIVVRAALNKTIPSKTGRWVMLAPPNRGSFVANRIPRLVRRVLKPIEELRASENSYVNRLPVPSGIDIAVVQATQDYVVAESLTHIPEEKARMVVPGLHSQLLFRDDVASESLHFLCHGQFSHRINRHSA